MFIPESTADSYQLTYAGNAGSPTATITTATTTAQIQAMLQGVNEVQTVSLSK